MRYFPYILSLMMLVLASACQDGPSADSSPISLQVEDERFSRLPDGSRVFTGKLFNTSPEPIDNAQIQVSLFDKNNLPVSKMIILVQDVAPGESKPFTQSVDTDPRIERARVRSILVL